MHIEEMECCGHYFIFDFNYIREESKEKYDIEDKTQTQKSLTDFLNGPLTNHIKNYQNTSNKSGKLYQLILNHSQWCLDFHKILLDFGFTQNAKWSNSTGEVCRSYQYITPEAERKGP